jgi:hypothetical protein
MITNNKALLVLCAVLTLVVMPAYGKQLSVYYTTKEARKNSIPVPGERHPWEEADADDLVNNITLKAGKRLWIACDNLIDKDNTKSFSIQLTQNGTDKLLGELEFVEAKGFTSDDEGAPVNVTAVEVDDNASDGTMLFKYLMNPQPKWERLEFKVMRDISGGSLKAVAASACFNAELEEPEWPDLKELVMTDSSFGAPGAVIGDPRIVRIFIFPRINWVNRDVAPSFVAPEHTGRWNARFVDTDPDGLERPLGGVLFATDGEGLRTEDRYDLSFAMIGDADQRYDMYAFEAERGEFLDFVIAAGQLGFFDSFESYAAGEEICGQAHWEQWDGSDGVCGQISEEQACSGVHSLRISGAEGPQGDDMVQTFDIVGGAWRLTTRVFVPIEAQGQAWIVLLNQYPANKNWSLQVAFDANLSRVYNFDRRTERAPMRKGEWMEFDALIDLDNDVVEARLDGVPFITNWSWREGIQPTGEPWIQALDLYAGEPGQGGITAIYFDDMELTELTTGACCFEIEGVCEDGVRSDRCVDGGGTFHQGDLCADLDPLCGQGACVREPEWFCDGDVDGNRAVNPVDVGLVQAAFCAAGECSEDVLCQYDLDCNGAINPVDSGIVQSLFGLCDAPRDVCP